MFLSVAAKQTTNLASINKANLRSLPIPLPTPDEQKNVVAALDLQLAATANMEADLRARLNDAAVLRRSVLRAAFEGQLVAPTSTDDFAEELQALAGNLADLRGVKAKR